MLGGAPRLVARRDGRDRQRGGRRRRDGGRAHHQGARAPAAPHHPRRAVERRGAGAPRLARLRRAALRQDRDPAADAEADPAGRGRQAAHGAADARTDAARPARDQAGVREVLRLLQPRQRDGAHPRRLHAGQRRRAPALPPLARALRRPRRADPDALQHGQHRPHPRSTPSACPASSSYRTESSTTRARTTRRRTPTTASRPTT